MTDQEKDELIHELMHDLGIDPEIGSELSWIIDIAETLISKGWRK